MEIQKYDISETSKEYNKRLLEKRKKKIVHRKIKNSLNILSFTKVQ